MSIGMVAVYGLFNLTPKFLSPLKSSIINTPICISPTRAVKVNKYTFYIYKNDTSKRLNKGTNCLTLISS